VRQVLSHKAERTGVGSVSAAQPGVAATIGYVLIAAFVIVLVAAAIQSVTGFGYSLVAVPLLTIATGPHTAVVALALPGLLLAVITMAREREHVRWRTVTALLVAVTAGMPVGLVLLRILDDRALTLLVAVTVLLCTALVWRNPQFSVGYASIAAAGVTAGVLSTTAGPSGPPLIAAMQGMGYGRRTLRATLAAVFTFGGVLSIGGFAIAGALTDRAMLVGAVGGPAVLVGWWTGNILFDRIDGTRFRQAVLVILVISCLLAVARTVNSR
jgi:uncharacterized membrane protein YfcA